MKALQPEPTLVEKVHKAILAEIAAGKLPAGTRLIQEQIAQELGVSRQPIQQALTLLKQQGLLQDAPGRGLLVVPLDLDHVRQMYDIRAVLEGLAFAKAAELGSQRMRDKGPALIRSGRKAAADGSVNKMIAADMDFHDFIYELSGNPMVASSMEMHWTYIQRVMGEVLMRDEKPRDIWDQHEELMDVVAKGKSKEAERLARRHILEAADFMIERLQSESLKG